jgi:hypothetical protein
MHTIILGHLSLLKEGLAFLKSYFAEDANILLDINKCSAKNKWSHGEKNLVIHCQT